MNAIRWFEFKKLYSANNPNDYIFRAYVADKNTYRIVCDKNNLFKNIFLSIIRGEYKMYKLNKPHNEYEEILINNDNIIDNIKQYINMQQSEKLKNRFMLNETNLVSAISYHFEGPDFNYEQGMLPTAFNKSNNIVFGISAAISNDYDMQEQFILQRAGSLIYDLYIPENENIEKIKNVIININNNTNNIQENNEYMYNISKYLYDLRKIKNLESLQLTFYDNETITINMNNIEQIYNRVRKDYITIRGVPDRYSNKDNSFRIKKFACYLEEPDNETIAKIKQKSNNKEIIEISGKIKQNHDNTILVECINTNI